MKWHIYQVISAKVTELQSDGFIASFDGQLCRIQNRSGRKFELGQRVDLEVIAVNPYRFRLKDRSSGHHISKSV